MLWDLRKGELVSIQHDSENIPDTQSVSLSLSISPLRPSLLTPQNPQLCPQMSHLIHHCSHGSESFSALGPWLIPPPGQDLGFQTPQPALGLSSWQLSRAPFQGVVPPRYGPVSQMPHNLLDSFLSWGCGDGPLRG